MQNLRKKGLRWVVWIPVFLFLPVLAEAQKKTDPKTEPDAKAKVETKVETKTPAKTEAKVDARADRKENRVDAKVEVKPDKKSDPKLDTKADPKIDARVDVKADTKAKDEKAERAEPDKTEPQKLGPLKNEPDLDQRVTDQELQIPPEMVPENLAINWKGDDTNPMVSPDGSFIVFQSDRPGSAEGSNFWFSHNKNFTDRSGQALHTVPLPLRFPLSGQASDTMKILRPGGIEEDAGQFTVNTDGFDGAGSILWRKGKPVEMYLTSDRAARGEGFDGLNIYFTRFREDRWSKPIHLNIMNSNFDDRMPCVSDDGQILVFVSNRPGGYGGDDLYLTRRDPKTGQWSEPVNLGPEINTKYNEISPSLSPGTQMLFYSSNRPGGLGHYDIYVSRNKNGFQKAENLGQPFNSDRDDEYMSFTSDMLWVYFASERRNTAARGGMDIYRMSVPEWLRETLQVQFTAMILDGSTKLPLGVEATVKILWEGGTIVQTSKLFNRGPTDPSAFNFSTTLESGRFYRVEISAPGFYPQAFPLNYRGNVPANKREHRRIYLEKIKEGETTIGGRVIPGKIIDVDNGLPVSGTRLRRMVAGKAILMQTDSQGRFEMRLTKAEVAELKADAPGYEINSITVQESNKLKEIVLTLKLIKGSNPCAGDEPVCIENQRIFFQTGSPDIDVTQRDKLDAVVRILNKHKDLKVEVRGHTDKTFNGPEANRDTFNLELSKKRAENVRQALIGKGIVADRLKFTGVSFSEPADDENTEKGRARNRRVEFKRMSLDK